MSWKDDARKRVKDAGEGNLWKPQEGPNYFRYVPNKKGPEERPYLDWGIHRDVGPDKAWVRCGLEVKGSCWLCDKLSAMVASDPSKQRLADAMARHDQLVIQIAPIDPDTQKFSKPKAWWLNVAGRRSMGMKVISFLSTRNRDYEHPAKGFNINMERTGTGMNTEYGPFEPDPEPSRIPKEVFASAKHLEELIPAYSAEDQKAAFFGRPKRDEAPAEEEEGYSHTEEEEEEGSAEDTDGDAWGEETETETEPEAEESEETESEGDYDWGEEGSERPEAELEAEAEPEAADWEWDVDPKEEESEPAKPRHPPAKKAPATKHPAPPAKKAPPPAKKVPTKRPAPPTKKATKKHR